MDKVTRRGFLATGLATAAGRVAPRRISSSPPARAINHPRNVLLIMSDQHTRSALGVAGNSVVRTPHLDALAKSGVLFDDAYCTPRCLRHKRVSTAKVLDLPAG
jgi:hypothetical protein